MKTTSKAPKQARPAFSTIRPIKARRRAFLDDGVAYYSVDPKTRRAVRPVSGADICQYSPTATSEGCIIGRYAPETHGYCCGVAAIFSRDDGPLPRWMRDMGLPFLVLCQELHDKPGHWNMRSGGLSVLGKKRYAKIVKEFC